MAPKIVDREERRRALAAAAAEVFTEKGFAGTRIADVAERAGVGKGTVYEYFRSKEELFFAVFEAMTREEMARLGAELDRDAPSLDRLAAMVRSMVSDAVAQVELYGLTLEFWSGCTNEAFGEQLRTEFSALYQGFRAHVAAIVRQGQEAGELRPEVDPEGLAASVVGAIDALGLQYWIDRGVDATAAAEALLEVLSAGLAVQPRAPDRA